MSIFQEGVAVIIREVCSFVLLALCVEYGTESCKREKDNARSGERSRASVRVNFSGWGRQSGGACLPFPAVQWRGVGPGGGRKGGSVLKFVFLRNTYLTTVRMEVRTWGTETSKGCFEAGF